MGAAGIHPVGADAWCDSPRYDAPGGGLGDVVARLFGEEPEQQVRDDLRRFKQVIETGEVVTSEGTPDGTKTGRLFKQREAQPVSGRPS
jgi:hypothetical protein